MAWIKLDDKAPRHPKIAGLSDRAFRAWVSALCYASEFLTDGILPVAFLVTVRRVVQEELILAGLWRVNTDQLVAIHDYLDHQRDKVSVRRERARNAERQSRHRNAVTNGVNNAVSHEKVTRLDQIREDLNTPPNPPSRGELAVERDPTRKERQWAEKLIKSHGGCPHEPKPCGDEYTCIGRLVGERRDAERAGLKAVAS